jgi:outer membrane immunogenic protein
MKKLSLGSIALVALGLGAPTAFAADMRVAAAPPPVPVYTWSGCYVGASAGTSNGSSQHIAVAGSTFNNPGLVNPAGTGTNVIGVSNVIPAGTNITDRFNLSGFIGGFQGGCNWQWGAWIFGIEGDGSATNKSGQDFERPLVALAAGSANWISQTQERWLVTARARLGWPIWDRTMVYVTGGGAWAKIDASEWLVLNPIFTGHQESNVRGGWTVGGGAEYALGYGWSVKGEFLYVKFDDYTTFTTGPFAPGNVSPREVRLEDYIWRAGMNYKFW